MRSLITDNRLCYVFFWVSVLPYQRWVSKGCAWTGLFLPGFLHIISFLTHKSCSLIIFTAQIKGSSMNMDPAGPPEHLHRIRSLSLRWKMLIGFGLLFSTALALVVVILTFGIPFTAYTGSYGYEQAQVLSHLSLVADLKREASSFGWKSARKMPRQSGES